MSGFDANGSHARLEQRYLESKKAPTMPNDKRDASEVIQRKLDLLLALSIYTSTVVTYRPRKKTIGNRLWDLI